MVLLGLPATAAAQAFTFNMVEVDLPHFSHGDQAWADLDGDGRLDLVVAGNAEDELPFRPATLVAFTRAEQDQGPGALLPQLLSFDTEAPTTAVWHPALAWADYDRDGDPDFVLTGTTRTGATFEAGGTFDAVTRLYRNDGTGRFAAHDAGLDGVFSSTAAWADYDNDGDADLLLAGLTPDETPATRLYRNTGGTFEAVEAPFRQVAFGDAAWADYDNDGDLDLALAGVQADGLFVARLYRNDGSRFAEVDAGLPPLAFASLDWGDYDADGDPDLAISGGQIDLPEFFEGVSLLFRNDGGTFARLDAGLDGAFYGETAWADYDVDGDLDLLVVGAEALAGGRTARVYRNDDGRFAHAISLAGLYAAAASWGDYDGDTDLDLITTGLSFINSPITRLYRNDIRVVNAAPAAPAGLAATVQGTDVRLAWDAASDDYTPAAGLTYNLRVGTQPGASDVVAALATAAGRRLVPAHGNVGGNTSWPLRGLPGGTYFWSVQAIDAGFRGSAFAAEGTFTVGSGGQDALGTGTDDASLPTVFALHPAFPNPFRETVTLGYDVPEAAPVTLTVYDLLGREVARLLDAPQPPGRLRVAWDGRDDAGRPLGAGLYVVRMRAGGAVFVQSILRLK